MRGLETGVRAVFLMGCRRDKERTKYRMRGFFTRLGMTRGSCLYPDKKNALEILQLGSGTRNRTQKAKGDLMSILSSKVALVTGGSRGIGAAIAKRLAADGASVAITYAKDATAASAVVKAIEGNGGKALAIQADASQKGAVQGAVDQTVATFGQLDVLVNNAGTAIPKPFEETTLEEMDRMFDVNVRGVMAATRAALKHMKSGGRIIMIGSCVGERVMTPGLVAYSASKGAVKMFVQGLSREIGGRGITVNNVQPGPIDTELNPAAGDWAVPQKAATALGRYGQVEEVAALVSFVASPESSYMTGTNLTVDGGTNA
jgi:3-oxoacyl-[acyl-carrier protein] reductase